MKQQNFDEHLSGRQCSFYLKMKIFRSMHRGIKPPPLKNTTRFFLAKPNPPLNLQTVQAPLFRQSPFCIGFS